MIKALYFISIYLIITVLLQSCVVPNHIIKSFNNCYNKGSTGLDSIISIRGYYSNVIISKEKDQYTRKGKMINYSDTTYSSIMFFDDGLFASSLFGIDLSNRSIRSNNISTFLSNLNKSSSIKIGATYWGTYKICGDTIKAMYINYASGITNTWRMYESWFIIISNNTIKTITHANNLDNKSNRNELVYQNENSMFIFNPIELNSKLDCWILNKKWFWCNKNEWKKHKHNLKNSKD